MPMRYRPAALFFLHVPKTAGTSLRAYLVDQYSEQATFPQFDYRDLGARDLERIAAYDLVMGHFDARLLAGLQRYAHASAVMLREPVDRTISAIRHAIADPTFRPSGVAMQGRALREVIRDPEVMARFANNQTGLLSASGGDGAAWSFDSIEPDLDLALANLARFDVVGLAEDFDAGMRLLARRCGLYPVKSTPRLNVAAPLPDEVLAPAERAIVASYNTLDLALYAAARRRHGVDPAPSRQAVLDGLPDACFPALDGSALLPRHPFCGYGFYGPDDTGPGQAWRWTGPATESGITFRLRAVRRCLFYVEYLLLDGYATRVEFRIDGARAHAEVFEAGGIWFAKIPYVPARREAHHVELELHVDRVAAGAQDVRPRGLVVSALSAIAFA